MGDGKFEYEILFHGALHFECGDPLSIGLCPTYPADFTGDIEIQCKIKRGDFDFVVVDAVRYCGGGTEKF